MLCRLIVCGPMNLQHQTLVILDSRVLLYSVLNLTLFNLFLQFLAHWFGTASLLSSGLLVLYAPAAVCRSPFFDASL